MTMELRSLARAALTFSSRVGGTLGSLLAMAVEARLMRLPSIEGTDAPCIVLGTGPSLQTDLTGRMETLSAMNVFAVNGFALSNLFERLQPSIYLVLDPDYWRDDAHPEAALHREEFFRALEAKTRWPLLFLVPRACGQSSSWKRRGGIRNPYIRVCLVNRNPVQGFCWFRNLAYRWNLGMPWAQNVLVGATFFAVRLGFRQIYLLGADHSWHEELEVGEDNVLFIRQKHFYDGGQLSRVPFYKCGRRGIFKMHEIYEAWAKAFRGYFVVREYAESVGATILNAGSKSYVDAFQRIRVEDWLGPSPAAIGSEFRPPAVNAVHRS
jgi:hypothetical protein